MALVWIDLEMTGLDPHTDHILEIAVCVTHGDLDRVVEGPDVVVATNDETLAQMNEWCVEHHGRSGLTEACRRSTISLAEAENQVLDFLSDQGLTPGTCPLAGNSVWTDRFFLVVHMPRLASFLHYRTVDVSTLKELNMRFLGHPHLPKKLAHRAMDDIKESIEELRYYMRVAMVKANANDRRR